MNRLRQNGSAITEFIVSLLVVIPLITLFTLTGKLSDVEHAAQSGARYQAWEVAIAGAPNHNVADLKSEVHKRILDPKAFIQSTDSQAPVDQNPPRYLWGMYGYNSGENREAIVSFDEQGYVNGLSNNAAGLDVYGLNWDVPVLGTVGIDDLENDGLYDARVGFAINDVTFTRYSGNVNCGHGTRTSYLTCMERNNALLVDDWSAGSPQSVQERITKLNPGLALWEPFAKDVVDPIISVPFFIPTLAFDFYEPFDDIKRIADAPGFVLPDIVPQRNLGSYSAVGMKKELD